MESIASRGPSRVASGALFGVAAPVRAVFFSLCAVVLLSCLAEGSAGAAGAQPASAATPKNGNPKSGDVTFGIEPATAQRGDGRPFLNYGATRGAVLFDHVAAVNYSSAPLTLQVYATDAVETTAGGYGLLPADVKPTGVGSWISIPAGSSTVTVPADSVFGPGETIIPFELRVPRTVQPGDYSGGIVVSLQTLGKNGTGQNVELQQRVGTRLFVRVSGPLHPKLVLTVMHSGYSGVLNPVGKGKVVLAYKVTNAGNVNLGINQSVTVSTLFGSKIKIALKKIALLFPGTQITERVTVPGVLPEVIDHRSIVIDPVLPKGSAGPDAPELTSGAIVWAVPWSLIVVILLVVLAITVWFRARRTSGKGNGHANNVDVTAATSDRASVLT
jgi:hypothetical protein